VARAALFACVFFRAGVCSMMDGWEGRTLLLHHSVIFAWFTFTLHSLKFPLSFFYFIARGATG
jgi:hypothetical protein